MPPHSRLIAPCHLIPAGLPLAETAYTALARMAASAGDGAAALEAAQAMVASGVPPRLRSFTPALLAFSTTGQVRPRTGPS